MRGGLSAIQQTLTPEAATVLTHSIAEAARRSHGQTTPLHVAATLLAAPNGLLRQACIRSHPNSSHPLQCRALELCFSVALERLPTTAGAAASPPAEPPLSNALVAALKRAQAHQRRGCPEQQQQPLLAVKVELEQLIISILDDPSVSRVMKEASFSSPAVKAAIEQAVSSQPSTSPGPRIGLGFRGPNVGGGGGGRSLYLNPRLQQQGGCNNVNLVPSGAQGREEDIKKVMDILGKPTKRNPILVGESEPQEVVKEVLKRVDKIRDGVLKDFTVMSMEKEFGLVDRSQMWVKVKELGNMIERKMLVSSCTNGIILDVGDLKWLVDQPVNPGVSELARQAVSEMGKILRIFSEGRRVWFIGTATCETYLRCQVYHPTMESEWDLQVVSVVAKAKPPVPGMLPRLGTSGGILSSSVECLTPMKSFPMAAPPLTRRVSENTDPLKKLGCCPHCTEKYNQELAKLTAEQAEKSSSEVKSDSTQKSLPFWLQNAKLNNNNNNDSSENNKDKDSILNRQKGELQKKWTDACLQLHPSFHRGVTSEKRIMASPLSITSLYNNNSPVLLGRQPSQSKPQKPKSLGEALQLNISPPFTQQPVSNHRPSPPSSPVRTDLMLGLTKPAEKAQEKDEHPPIKDLLGCISSESQNKKLQEKPTTVSDADSFKKLLKGLMDKVWWQKEAASALASTMTQCKSGNGKSRAGGSKGDIWLMFSGPDRIGKKKMAAALSELVCGMAPILISLGPRRDGDESDMNFRGKTALDRIVEAVRRNPFAVIMLQDIDEADMLIRGSIKRAMERGRLVDSHGREISLGNIIFILTSSWAPGQQKGSLGSGIMPNEEKLMSLASGGWQLRISIDERSPGKRPPSWLHDDHGHQGRATKQRKESGPGLSFDLNQRADIEDDRLDGSHNSSDLTMDHEEEHVHQNRAFLAASSAAHEFLGSIDEAIIFKPVDFTPIKQNIERIITARFSTILGDKFSLKIENEALERISSGVWLGQTSLESWAENVLLPSFHQMKTTLPSMGSPEGKLVARLELDNGSGSRNHGDWLPSRVSVVTNGS